MFEDSRQANRFQITRNEKQNPNSNKLISHFQNSTFLAQQQELSTFIKNLPLIKFEQINSLNKLIELLIRQNQVLGNKCQQNVLTVNQMFHKHQELVRMNRDLQKQLRQSQQEIEHNSISQHQMISYEQKINVFKEQNKEKDETISKLKQMTEQLMEQNKHCLGSLQDIAEIIKYVGEKNYKKAIEKVKELNYVGNKEHWEWLELDSFERYLKDEKKRAKYIPKVRQTVESFCQRFLKISVYVSGDMVKSQFNREVGNMLEIIDDMLLPRKKSNNSSQSRLTQYSHDCNFFEGLLDKILKEKDSKTNSQEEIAGQLGAVRQELQQCKKYYEQYLMKTKFQCQESIRRKDEQLTQKTQLLEYYESSKEKQTVEIMEMRQHLKEVEQCLRVERLNSEVKGEEINSLEKKLQLTKVQAQLKQKQIKNQWQQNINTYEYKLAQKVELFEEQQRQRKALKAQIDQERTEFKKSINELQEREKKTGQRNRQLTDTIEELNSTVDKLKKKLDENTANYQQELGNKAKSLEESTRNIQKQHQTIKRMRQQQETSEKEKDLQAAYIRELEYKNKELLSKIKSFESKKIEEKTAKKEMDSMKKTFIEEKKYSRQVEDHLLSQKTENHRQKQQISRLKSIIKEMKRQLEEVYHQLTNLKVIENDRQKLVLQMQKSDRLREQLFKNGQQLKIQLLKCQQQNKGMALEIRHYKNALSRIEALKI